MRFKDPIPTIDEYFGAHSIVQSFTDVAIDGTSFDVTHRNNTYHFVPIDRCPNGFQPAGQAFPLIAPSKSIDRTGLEDALAQLPAGSYLPVRFQRGVIAVYSDDKPVQATPVASGEVVQPQAKTPDVVGELFTTHNRADRHIQIADARSKAEIVRRLHDHGGPLEVHNEKSFAGYIFPWSAFTLFRNSVKQGAIGYSCVGEMWNSYSPFDNKAKPGAIYAGDKGENGFFAVSGAPHPALDEILSKIPGFAENRRALEAGQNAAAAPAEDHSHLIAAR